MRLSEEDRIADRSDHTAKQSESIAMPEPISQVRRRNTEHRCDDEDRNAANLRLFGFVPELRNDRRRKKLPVPCQQNAQPHPPSPLLPRPKLTEVAYPVFTIPKYIPVPT